MTAGSYYSLFLGTSHQTSFKHQVKFALQQSKPLLSHLEGFSLQIQVSCALNFQLKKMKFLYNLSSLSFFVEGDLTFLALTVF